jgi:quinol monooxygenase YgiN
MLIFHLMGLKAGAHAYLSINNQVGRRQAACRSTLWQCVPLLSIPTSFLMTSISKDNKYLTLINIFKVAPEDQRELVELLTKAAESVRKIPGFVSSSLHRSMDGTRVTMYAQWRSLDDYNRMRANPTVSPFLDKALEIATFEPGMYEVVETFMAVQEK